MLDIPRSVSGSVGGEVTPAASRPRPEAGGGQEAGQELLENKIDTIAR